MRRYFISIEKVQKASPFPERLLDKLIEGLESAHLPGMGFYKILFI